MDKRIWLLDVDGVIANNKHRLHFITDKNYDKFYNVDMVASDTVIPEFDVIEGMITGGSYLDNEVILVTGRPERTRDITMKWIKYNYPSLYPFINDDDSMFRKDHDYRKSHVVKAKMVKDLYEKLEQKPNSFVVIDDDPDNVINMKYELEKLGAQVTGLVFGTDRFNDYVQNISS